METAIIIFHIHKEHRTVDLEVPLDLTAKELAAALNEAYGLGVDLSDIQYFRGIKRHMTHGEI